MYSTFFGIELGKSALLAQELAMSTTGHNIANVNTPGYSRQRANLAAALPLNLPDANRACLPGQIGSGVEVSFMSRARDMLLEGKIQEETSTLGTADAMQQYFSRIEDVLQEPSDSSLGSAMDAFFAAWHDVSANPEDMAVRATLVSAGQRLTYLLNTKDAALAGQQQQADVQIRTAAAQINALGAQIRDVNVRINQSLGVETQPNDLMDVRDDLLAQLSKLAGVQTHVQPNGLAEVTIGGHTLVQDSVFVPVTVTNDPLNGGFALLTWSDDASAVNISDGEIAGLTAIRDVNIPVYRQALDTLATGLMGAINPVHAAGYAYNAAAPSGLNFFTGTNAGDIAINPILIGAPDQLAVASNPTAPGDGSNALAIAQLQQSLSMAAGTQTFGTFYQTLVAQVGLDSQHNESTQTAQTKLLESFTQQQQSVAGVNLDEEMTNLIKYQDGYQAATRVISMMDTMLDTLINRMGAGH
jgi:flagellar hook-associated protein 1